MAPGAEPRRRSHCLHCWQYRCSGPREALLAPCRSGGGLRCGRMGFTAATVSVELRSESMKSSCFFRALSWLLALLLSAVSTWLLASLLLSEYLRNRLLLAKRGFLPSQQPKAVNCQYRRKLLLRHHSPPVPVPEPPLVGEVRRTMAAARLRR